MRYLGVRTMVVATQSSSVSLAKIFLESANWGLPHAVQLDRVVRPPDVDKE